MTPPVSRTLFELVREAAGRWPEYVAVICRERTVTYRDLAEGAGRVGAALKGHGIRRGERVGILVNNRLEWLEACFGAAALGAVAVPFSTWSKPGELAYLLADSEVAALIAVASFGGQDFAAALAALVPEASAAMPGRWCSRDFPHLRLIVMLGGGAIPAFSAVGVPRSQRACRIGHVV
jgi:fatty-acyl-CoA synthase